MNPFRPYIGITDFTDVGQAYDLMPLFESESPCPTHSLMIGVMMSRKTLLGLPSRWTGIFPKKDAIAQIFSSNNAFAYNCLHYADYGNDPDLSENLCDAIMCGGIGIHAVQLDMIWPDPGAVAEAVHRSRKRVDVILQVGRKATDLVRSNPREAAERLLDYEGVVNGVLLDWSMGAGKPMSPADLLPFVRTIYERCPGLCVAVAGGLGPGSLDLALPIIREHPEVSIDAQSKLRRSGSAEDPIDWGMAQLYVERALGLFRKKEPA